jgi:hypothetical protein
VKLKKFAILTLILLSFIDLGYANEEVYSSAGNGNLTYLETYMQTYNTLVELQSVDKDLFFLHNKTLLIIAIISNQGGVAYYFNETNLNTSKFGIY